MQKSFTLAFRVLTAVLSIVVFANVAASIELSIDAVSVDESSGSFVVTATAPDPSPIGAYSIGLQFHEYVSVETVNYDAVNLASGMSELGEFFGTTPHPVDVSEGTVVHFASIGPATVSAEPLELLRVDFTMPDLFLDNQSYSVRLIDSEIGDAAPIVSSDSVVIRGQATQVILPCDLNGDTVCNAADIDLLSAEIRANSEDARFDLNDDVAIDNADRLFWISDLMNTYVGDADLDGEFDSGDFVTVFSANEYEDSIVGNSTWATGDWNGDAEFDSGDFVAAFTEGGYEKGPKPTQALAVPEPNNAVVWLLLLVVFIYTIYRR